MEVFFLCHCCAQSLSLLLLHFIPAATFIYLWNRDKGVNSVSLCKAIICHCLLVCRLCSTYASVFTLQNFFVLGWVLIWNCNNGSLSCFTQIYGGLISHFVTHLSSYLASCLSWDFGKKFSEVWLHICFDCCALLGVGSWCFTVNNAVTNCAAHWTESVAQLTFTVTAGCVLYILSTLNWAFHCFCFKYLGLNISSLLSVYFCHEGYRLWIKVTASM